MQWVKRIRVITTNIFIVFHHVPKISVSHYELYLHTIHSPDSQLTMGETKENRFEEQLDSGFSTSVSKASLR